MSYFTDLPGIREYDAQGVHIKINFDHSVFPPPQETPITAKYMKVFKGERLIDIGTGSGILAILAAAKGAYVCATDADQDAIKVARENADLNKVSIDARVGHFFGNFEGQFDVIVSNIAQTILPPSYEHPLRKTIDGGENGTENIFGILDAAKEHMHEGSRLYINIFTISDFKSSLRKMRRDYTVDLVAAGSEPVKEYVLDNLSFYSRLQDKGKIKIFKDKASGTLVARQYLYELRILSFIPERIHWF